MFKLDKSELEDLYGKNFDYFDCEYCSFSIDFEPTVDADIYTTRCQSCGKKHVVNLNE